MLTWLGMIVRGRRRPINVLICILAVAAVVVSLAAWKAHAARSYALRQLKVEGVQFGVSQSRLGAIVSKVTRPVFGADWAIGETVSSARLRGVAANPENMKNLSQMFPNLRGLFIGDREVSESIITHLQSFKELQTLMVMNARITDADLQKIRECDALRDVQLVWLSGQGFSEMGVVDLCHLPRLKKLVVWDDCVSVENIRTLCRDTGVDVAIEAAKH